MTRNRRQRLGRGLGALLGEEYLAVSGERTDVRTIPVGAISPNPFQPRREFREEELDDLQRSIRENGLLQPIVVRAAPESEGDRYELVAGERRLRSVVSLEWDSIPAVIRDVDDRTLLVLALVENIQRESLSPLEEAEGYQVLVEEFSLTQGEVADAVGRSRSSVANALRLLRLPPSVRRLLNEGALSMGHARALLGIEDPGRLPEMARRAVRESWSVREMEAKVRRQGGRRDTSQGKSRGARPITTVGAPVRDAAIRALEEELCRALGTRVMVKGGERGRDGTIRIEFTSSSDLERVFQLITGREPAEILD